MSYANGPRIITDGLVLHLDAANPRSYVSGSNSWNDLSGNGNIGTLTNGPTFNTGNKGSIVFDGSNDYVSVSGNRTLSAATFICYINCAARMGEYIGMMYSRDDLVANTGGMFMMNNGELRYAWGYDSNIYNWFTGLIIPNNTWCMVAVSLNSTSSTVYLNKNYASKTVTHPTITLNSLELGRDSYGGNRYWKGNISSAMIYNRALSAAEINQNYNATKGRYNL